MKKLNKGSITVEVCFVIPLFLFFMLSIAGIYMLLLADAHIHQSLAEAANYTAQYCYLKKKLVSDGDMGNVIDCAVLMKQFGTYLGEDFYVEKMVAGGKKGILITVTKDTENPKIFIAEAGYQIKLRIPLLGEFHMRLANRIKQKAFLGYSKEEQEDCYVYVTPNQEVYHTRRSCTHLELSIQHKKLTGKKDYTPCGFCAEKRNARKDIYVARTGSVYHYSRDCIGLKRTVKRVKKKEIGNLDPCQRCGR